MLKKILLTLVLCIAVSYAGVTKVEAAEVFVGTSPATGWKCYVLTETIEHYPDDVNFVTLRMYTNSGDVREIDYKIWHDPSIRCMRFSNDDGYSGIIDVDTPIEWEILEAIRHY